MKADPFERFRELFPRTVRPDQDPADTRRRLVAMLVSTIVAIALWFTVNMRETYTISVDAPLAVRSVPEGQALREAVPSTARVQLQGVGWDLLSLSRRPPEIDIYADGPTVDVQSAAAEAPRLPLGVLVQSATPQRLNLVLGEAVARRLPVQLTGTLDLEPGYGFLRPPQLRPDSVQVIGARSVLEGFEAWPTEPLNLDGLRRTRTDIVALSDTLGRLVERSVDQAEVTLAVGQFTEGTRMLDVRVENVPPGVLAVRLIPRRVRATYLVPIEGNHFGRADSSSAFYGVVDYADIAQDSTAGTVPVVPRLPEGLLVQDVQLEPGRLEYFTVRE